MVDFKRHSPSSLYVFAESPALFVLERMIGYRQPSTAPMQRGIAVEDGITDGLLDPEKPIDDCVSVALSKFDTISALSVDSRREQYRETIKAMVETGLRELRPYGVPSHTQGFIEWKPEGLRYPIVGYFDYHWEDHNITVDLKTTEKLPSSIKVAHARQVSLYVTSNNASARVSYVTPKKVATYSVDEIDAHRRSLYEIAKRCENFLALGDTPEFFKSITVPNLDSFFWSGPVMRNLAFEHWGV